MPRNRSKAPFDRQNFPQAARKRKKVQVTLSDEARAELERLAKERGERQQSAVIEDLLLPKASK